MKNFILAILCAISNHPSNLFATVGTNKLAVDSPEKVIIEGRIINGHPLKDTIRIEFYRTPGYGIVGAERTNIIINEKGRFHFEVNELNRPARITLYQYRPHADTSDFQYWINQYLINPGDSIQIQIESTKSGPMFHFSGKGSEKFQYQYCIDSVEREWSSKELEIDHSEFYNIENWKFRKAYLDSLCKVKFDVLKTFRDQLTEESYYILKADIVGNEYCNYAVNFYNPEVIRNDKIKYLKFYKEILSSPIDSFHSELMAYSPSYLEFLTRLSFLRTYYSNNLEEKYNFPNVFSQSISENYNFLKSNNLGYLREVLCLNYLTDAMMGNENNVVDSCMSDLQGFVSVPEIKVIVDLWQEGHAKNRLAYDFALPDPRGRIVHMSDFKGKVILLDIWFSGCGGCLQLAQQLQNTIYKDFTTNPDIVFISISGDRDKSVWLKSVHEEKYTRKENVNLYTNGLAFDHPFMKYYSFYGGPYLMIIGKNGRIYSSNPPLHDGLGSLTKCLKDALSQ